MDVDTRRRGWSFLYDRATTVAAVLRRTKSTHWSTFIRPMSNATDITIACGCTPHRLARPRSGQMNITRDELRRNGHREHRAESDEIFCSDSTRNSGARVAAGVPGDSGGVLVPAAGGGAGRTTPTT